MIVTMFVHETTGLVIEEGGNVSEERASHTAAALGLAKSRAGSAPACQNYLWDAPSRSAR